MAGAENEQVRIVERRLLDQGGVRLDRIAHDKGERPFEDAEMAAAGRNVVKAGPCEQECSERAGYRGDHEYPPARRDAPLPFLAERV